MQSLVNAGDDKCSAEELQSCRHFFADSELRQGKHIVFSFDVNNLTAQVIEKKFDRVLDKLKCAANFNIAHGFIPKNIEDGIF